MAQLIYIDRVLNPAEFSQKVISICGKLDVDPNWLMAVMFIESGLDHTEVNPDSGATGLIQFLPSTAIELKTTCQELRAMTNIAQLDYVYSYLKKYKSKINSFLDCYFAVFFPAAIGKYGDYILQAYGLSAEYIAELNSGYDANQDNKLTFREVESKVLLMVHSQYREMLTANDSQIKSAFVWTIEKVIIIAIAVTLITIGTIKLIRIWK